MTQPTHVSGTIKPLEWDAAVFCGQPCFYADSEFGAWMVVAYSGRDGRWAHTDPCGNDSDDDWDSAEAAKSAAQADYEARIAAQIQPDDSGEEWREIEQAYQPRLSEGYTGVCVSKPGFWFVKGPGPATSFAAHQPTQSVTQPALSDTDAPQASKIQPDAGAYPVAICEAGEIGNQIHNLSCDPQASEAGELLVRVCTDAVTDANDDNRGFWRSCSGCHELNEGIPTGPYHPGLKCYIGLGCHECGGIGAIWDTTDYTNMGEFLDNNAPQAAPTSEAGELVRRVMTIRHNSGNTEGAALDIIRALTAARET